MNDPNDADRSDDRRVPLRFDFVTLPLASPPQIRELHQTFEEFTAKTWQHPITNWTIEFSVPSTVRRPYRPPSHLSEDTVATQRRGPRRGILEVLDGSSRIACDVHCYSEQTSETLIHALSQVIQKHGVPRALMTDNGPSMIVAHAQATVRDLGNSHQPAVRHSPHKTQKKG